MIESGNLPKYGNSSYDINFTVNSPISGFEFSLMETGIDGSFKSANLVTISGKEGYLFDQSGNFFGGYKSGIPIPLRIDYDYNNLTFSYYHDDILMASVLDVTGGAIFNGGGVNLVMFEKYGASSVSISVNGSLI